MRQRANLIPAYVLHTRPYKDTSLLADLFTEHSGRISVVANGAKRPKSRVFGLLMPFAPILASFSGKTELFNLNGVEPNGLPYFLKGDRLLSGFYLNELLFKLLHSGDPHPELYRVYGCALCDLERSATKFEHEAALRRFEKCLLQEIGFGLQLDKTSDGLPVEAHGECLYAFKFGLGFAKLSEGEEVGARLKDVAHHIFGGQTLLALHHDNLQSPLEFQEAKRLLRIALEAVLNNRKIKSRELFK